MLEILLQNEFIYILNNTKRRFEAPIIPKNAPLRTEDIDDYQFDIIDAKEDLNTIKRIWKHGIASYQNGTIENTYPLRFICYDEYIHQFTYDDGQGHPKVNQLKEDFKIADYIVYDKSEKKSILLSMSCQLEDVIVNLRKEENNCLTRYIRYASVLRLKH